MEFNDSAGRQRERPITSEFELFEELRRLIARAEQGEVNPHLVCLLHETGEKIMEVLASPAPDSTSSPHLASLSDRRESPRLLPQEWGIMVQGELRFPVRILDLGGRGFGLASAQPISASSIIFLEVPTADGCTDTFSCFVVFCRPKESDYRIGLRLVAMLPRG